MFDIFGIFHRLTEKKEEIEDKNKRLAEIQVRKRQYRERKEKIIEYQKNYYNSQKEKEEFRRNARKEEVDKINSVCPSCHSTNRILIYKRIKGEIHGEGRICGLSGNGKYNINGNLDTYAINKCNDCGNEWKVETISKEDYAEINIFWTYNHVPAYFFRKVKEYLELKFDPEDITEPFDSLEEKQEDYIKRMEKLTFLSYYREEPKYMLDFALYEGFNTDIEYMEPKIKSAIFGEQNPKEVDKYSYQIPYDLWLVIKRILHWKGSIE